MVVLVGAVEEKEDRDALPRKVVVVGAEVETLFRPNVVDGVIPSSGCASFTRPSVSPRSECSIPIATIVSGQLRPTISALRSATMRSAGTGGFSVKYALPQSPFSSPLTNRKRTDRLGFVSRDAYASAISRTAAVPDASSSAPLLMLSPSALGMPMPM